MKNFCELKVNDEFIIYFPDRPYCDDGVRRCKITNIRNNPSITFGLVMDFDWYYLDGRLNGSGATFYIDKSDADKNVIDYLNLVLSVSELDKHERLARIFAHENKRQREVAKKN